MATKIAGILNVTPDSFSDGGNFFSVNPAVKKGIQLIVQGADFVDIGGESTHPDSMKVSAEEEIRRIVPVIIALKSKKIKISVDTYKPEVMKAVLEAGIDMINDVTALRNEESVELLSQYAVPIVMMYARNRDPKAGKGDWVSDDYIGEITRFFDERMNLVVKKGIAEQRLILDPGMGFFLGSNSDPSLSVLKNIGRLRQLGREIYLCTSRKSFIGKVLGRPVGERAAGTLATEIWGALNGVDYIRTHDVTQLHDGIQMIEAIQGSR